jgi:hypothetical protein
LDLGPQRDIAKRNPKQELCASQLTLYRRPRRSQQVSLPSQLVEDSYQKWDSLLLKISSETRNITDLCSVPEPPQHVVNWQGCPLEHGIFIGEAPTLVLDNAERGTRSDLKHRWCNGKGKDAIDEL